MKTTRFSRTLAMLLALIMVLGTVPVWAAASENAEIVQWNVTLRDNLQANFHLSIPETAVETATVRVAVGDAEAVSYNASELTKVGDNYLVSAYVAAAQMTDKISVSILLDGTEAVGKSYTLAQYAAFVLETESMSKYHEVALNMLHYGAMAQKHFDHNEEDLANAGYELENLAVVPTEEKVVAVEGAVEGISFHGASLLFQDRIAIRYYFNAPNGVEGYTFTVNDEAQEALPKDGLYYVQINGFNPQDYNNNVTLTVSDGAASQKITYSPMHYIIRMCNKSTTSESLYNLLVAMYGYHLAAYNLPDPTPEEMGYTRFTLKELGIEDGTQSGNLVNNKLVEGGLDMKYLDADVSFGSGIDASSGIKYGVSGAGAWDGFRIGLDDVNTLSVRYVQTNLLLKSITAEEVGFNSFTQTFNLKFASEVAPSEMEGRLNFTISMWINDQMVIDHLLVGDLTNMGDYVGILTWGAGSVGAITQETPEEMGYSRYTMADLGVADGSYADNAVRGAIPEAGVNGGYLDADVAFTYLPGSTTADSSTGVKIGHTGPASWDGLRIALADGDQLTVRCAAINSEIFTISAAEAGVETFTEEFNLKVATKMEAVSEGYTNVTISLWINDKLIKKNVQTGGISGIGEYAGILTWFGAGITVATPVIEVVPEETEPEVTEPEVTEPEVTEPEVTEPEVTEPEVTEPEVTEPEVTEPVADPTPEELGYTRYTLEGMGIADGTYNTNAVTCAAPANGLNNAYLDVDVSFSGAADGSSGIKIANTAAGSWDGIRIGLADGDQLTVRYTVSNQELKTFTPAEVGLTSFSETFNLKVATKLVDSETEGAKDLTLTMWINDKLVINHMLVGGVTGVGEYAGILSWGGASITVMSKQSAKEMGYTRYTLAGLGIADGTYNTNAVTCAENVNGLNNAYLDVDVSFSGVDGSSGIKIGNTAAGSWDGIRIGLADGDTLTFRAAATNMEIFTLTAAEAGVETFAETFNLKVATKIAFVSEGYHNVTLTVWINDQLIKKNVQTGGISGIGNCAGILSWNGASITVASQVTPEELGYTKITMADLGYADGTYDGNLVRTAEVSGGMDSKYLDVDVAFGEVIDGSSGIKIGNTAAGSWDGLCIGLTAEGNLIVQAMGSPVTVCTLTPAEAGVESFTETFNLKFAVKYAPIDETWTNVTINMWINDVQLLKDATTGGIKGMGNFAGMLTWNGASVTVATPA